MERLEKYRALILVPLSLLALGIGMAVWAWYPQAEPIVVRHAAATTVPLPTPQAMMRVYVTGAVVNPDEVYEVPAGSIVKDAIVAAGGLTDEAAPEYINQALALQDHQQVHVPSQADVAPPPTPAGRPGSQRDTGASPGLTDAVSGFVPPPPPVSASQSTLININTAPQTELESLPGIGPVLAQRIIDYRTTVGPFQTVDDLIEVSGIGAKTLDNLRALITVD